MSDVGTQLTNEVRYRHKSGPYGGQPSQEHRTVQQAVGVTGRSTPFVLPNRVWSGQLPSDCPDMMPSEGRYPATLRRLLGGVVIRAVRFRVLSDLAERGRCRPSACPP